MNGVLGDFEAEIVGGSIDTAGFGSACGHQDREPVNIVVPAIMDRSESTQVEHGCAPEFAGDKNQRVVEHATFLEVLHQRRNGLIDVTRGILVTHDVGMMIPTGMYDLDE